MKQTIRSLRQHRLRSFLSTIGILIGVGSVIAVVSVGEGFKLALDNQMKLFGQNLTIVEPGQEIIIGDGGAQKQVELTGAIAQNLAERMSGINRVVPIKFSDLMVEAGSYKHETRILGVGLDFFLAHQMRAWDGALFGPETEYATRVAVLGQEIAKDMFPSKSAVGQTIRINRAEYEIIGILKSNENMQLYGERSAVIVPLASGVKRLFGRDNVSVIEVEAKDAEPSALEKELRRELSQLLRVPQSFRSSAFRIKSVQSMKDEIEQIGLMVTIFLMFVSCVALFVGGIGIFNIMLVSVTERTREIGIRKAIGASKGDIFRQFLLEAITICLWGGSLGTLGAVLLCLMSNALLPDFPIPLSPWIIGLAALFSTVVGLLAGVAPARKAAALNPLEAIRFS